MTAKQFEQLTGHAPEQDDLERVNCEEVGFMGHYQCGVCGFCGWPRFIPNGKELSTTSTTEHESAKEE